MRLRLYQIALVILFLSLSDLSAQRDIAYIIPDIAAPGMNVYMEIIAPIDSVGTFGTDGFYIGDLQSNVRIELLNSWQDSLVTFGPLVVSWNGRLISTQVFVNPFVRPNDFDWRNLRSDYIVPVRVIVNGQPTNTVNLYVVKPFPAGDRRSDGNRTLGSGSLGIRSPRGALIVDSLILANATYNVSLTDPDPTVAGNQAYLPFILLSKGSFKGGGPASAINVSGNIRNAGPGGGGGGGNFGDRVSGIAGNDGGSGFTGGGSGGANHAFGGGNYRSNGVGSGSDGNSLNEVLGGKPAMGLYETGPGGTGHPFGVSGLACFQGYTCEPEGQFGGGSGIFQDNKGGAGGYGTDGIQPGFDNNGHVHGNVMSVPVAGGSGGSSGNPQGVGQDGGSGGGGGGALVVFGTSIEQIVVNSKGGDGADGSNNSDGGAGSGGFIGLFSKTGITDYSVNVTGGSTNGNVTGGAGRLRWDSPSFFGSSNNSPTIAPNYRGITSDTATYRARQFRHNGSRDSRRNVRAFIKPESGPWSEIPVTSLSFSWYVDINLVGTDSVYYFMAMQEVPNPSTTDFNYEPAWVMSQAAANIFILQDPAKIDGDSISQMKLIGCPGDEARDTLKLYNRGSLDLNIDFSKAKFRQNTPGLRLVRPLNQQSVKSDDSIELELLYTYRKGMPYLIYDTLEIPHDDMGGRPNPWLIYITINIVEISYECYDAEGNFVLGDFYLGTICPGEKISRKFAVVNYSDIQLTYADPEIIDENTVFSAQISGPRTALPGDTVWVEIYFGGDNTFIKSFVTSCVVKPLECEALADTINVIVTTAAPTLELVSNTDFGKVKLGRTASKNIVVKNTGTYGTYINNLPVLNPPFNVVGSIPQIPPPLFLKAGDSLELVVEFTPLTTGMFLDSMKLTGLPGDSACSDSLMIYVSGEGIFTQLFYTPDSLYYGIRACESVLDSIVFINRGTEDITISSAVINGPGQAFFTLMDNFNYPYVLTSGDTLIYHILFTAPEDESGLIEARFIVLTDAENDEVIDIGLTGFIEDFMISSNPPAISLGMIPIGYDNTRTLRITNAGTLTWQMSGYGTMFGNAVVSVLPAIAVFPGGNGFIDADVTIKLPSPGDYRDTLLLFFDKPCMDTLKIPLEAYGLKAGVNYTNLLDYGRLAYCEDSTMQISMRDTGDAALKIDSVWIEGPDATQFSLVTYFYPDSLYPSEEITQDILFVPGNTSDGVKTAKCIFRIFMNGDTVLVEVPLRGEKQSGLLAYPSPVDFGRVVRGFSSTKKLVLKNASGGYDIKINSMIPPTQPNIFTINPAQITTTIKPGDSLIFDATFYAENIQDYIDSVGFETTVSTCDETRFVRLLGSGIEGDSVIVWFMPDTLVQPDIKNFRIPLYISRLNKGDTIRGMSYNAKVSFEASLIFPNGVSKGAVTDNYILQDKRRYLEFSGSNVEITDSTSVLNEILCATMLGDRDSTSLVIDDFEWLDPGTITYTELRNGLLRIIICRAGGDRLLKFNYPVNFIISPNPADDRINLELKIFETGVYNIGIYDLNSRLIKNINWEHGEPGNKDYSYSLDISDMAPGVYYLILRTPSKALFLPLIVVD